MGTQHALGNQDWWPNQLNLKVLHASAPQADPLGPKFDYAKEFKSLDLKALKKDNTGYNLRDLFIGSEGTLGIVTRAVLALHPRPKAVETAHLHPPKDFAIAEQL